MTNLKVLGAVVIAASTLSSPALAQAALTNPDAYEDEFGNNPNIGPGSPYTSGYRYRHSYGRTAYRQPATGAAVGPAGAAVGAAADATAPFRGWGNSYAQYGGEFGWRGDWNSYAARNGIVCRPGTYFKGDDGLRHLCQ
jgi:hypothetical protein